MPRALSFVCTLTIALLGGATALYTEDGPVTIIQSVAEFEEEVINSEDAVWLVRTFERCAHVLHFGPDTLGCVCWTMAKCTSDHLRVSYANFWKHLLLPIYFTTDYSTLSTIDFDYEHPPAVGIYPAFRWSSTRRGVGTAKVGCVSCAQIDVSNMNNTDVYADLADIVSGMIYPALAPAYTKVAENLKGVVKVAAVDVTEDANKAIAQMFGIQGFPTIKLFPHDRQMNPYTKKMSKTPMDYEGPRTGTVARGSYSEELAGPGKPHQDPRSLDHGCAC
eukprot:2247357-Pyramimonas_sp.AAC.1